MPRPRSYAYQALVETRIQRRHSRESPIDSKLRAGNLVKPRVSDVCDGDRVSPCAIVMQQKTQRPVQFEITDAMRDTVGVWVLKGGLRADESLFPSRIHESPDDLWAWSFATPQRSKFQLIEKCDCQTLS